VFGQHPAGGSESLHPCGAVKAMTQRADVHTTASIREPVAPPEDAAPPPATPPRAQRAEPAGRRLAPVLVPVIAGATGVIAAAVWSFAGSGPGGETLAGVAALLLAAVVAEAYPVPIEGVGAGRTSLATVFIVATASIYGWDAATIVAALTMAVVEAGRRRPISRITYNTALYALAAAAAGAAAGPLDGAGLVALALGTLVGSVAFYLVNIALLAAVVARAQDENALAMFARYLHWTAVPFWIMASLTIILVVLWERSPLIAVVLVGPLLTIALYERRMHAALNRLRELDRLKDEFIAVVSHELRTPLASVYGAAVTLEQGHLDDSRREAMLGIVYRESARLARLVDQVLWASRLGSARDETTIEPLDAEQITREVVDSARAHLPPGYSLSLSSGSPLPPVAGDAEKVKQVLFNLVENAVKYSPDGGRIDVALEATNGALRFSVRDEGLGIPAAEQRRIFEKFHRLDPNLRRGVAGTGLGLYICSELVKHMNGRIWVRSAEGEGSTFTFELPRAEA
jgi:signal transduction histidine kinase